MVRSLPPHQFEITICVNDTALEERADESAPDELTSYARYIESKTGQNFSIHIKIDTSTLKTSEVITARVYIDGQRVQAPIFGRRKGETTSEERKVTGRYDTPTTCQPFLFESLRIEEKDLCSDRNDGHADLGTIKVEFMLGRNGRSSSFSPEPTDALRKVSEKAVKGRALSHNTQFAASITAGVINYFKYDDVEPALATFKFYYRSKACLQSMLLIPRTPSPEPLERRDASTLSLEDIRNLQAAYARNTEAQDRKIKSERQIKREREESVARDSKKHCKRGAIIEIELDDDGEVVSETAISEPKSSTQSVIEID